MSLFWGDFMKDRERPSDANHTEQADRIHDSLPPVSSAHASTRNDERVSMRPRAETEVFEREQHSSQTQPAAPEREASSVDIWEYKRLKEQVRTLTEKIASLTKERNDLRDENQELQTENKELREEVEGRKEQNRQAKQQWRQKNPEESKRYQREYMRQYRAKKKQD
jgi:regulator of replication initiation timing